MRSVGSRAAAEDVVQEVFTRAWVKAPGWQSRQEGGGASYGAWLARVAVNLCIDGARRQRNHHARRGAGRARHRRECRRDPPCSGACHAGCARRSRRCPRASVRRSASPTTPSFPTPRARRRWTRRSGPTNFSWCARAARCAFLSLTGRRTDDRSADLRRRSGPLGRCARAVAGARARRCRGAAGRLRRRARAARLDDRGGARAGAAFRGGDRRFRPPSASRPSPPCGRSSGPR